ncbi:MAG: hypothetical protein OEY03_17170, partial [Rhizobacter sp.]|nr:hypothetical protein [Rhizobacter sp.]
RACPVLITIVGWFAMLAGLGRMAAPVAAQRAGQSALTLYGSLILLFAIGFVLTVKAYSRAQR